MPGLHRQNRRGGHRLTKWVVGAIVVLLVCVVLWVAVRALIARDQLTGAMPLVQSVREAVLDGERAELQPTIAQLQQRTATAETLTSDPVWRVAEVIPVLGDSLRAFREAAAMIHGVTTDALPPLVSLAETVTLDEFTPNDGAIDLAPFLEAAPLLAEARTALESASESAQAIDTSNTIPQVGLAVEELVDLVTSTQQLVAGIDTAATLLPTMLGGDGQRNYLVLSLNNAELRATGGIPGALSVVSIDNGVLTLGAQSSSALGEFSQPVLPLTDAERTLYHDILGTYIQDVNFTPNFARSGALAQEMWAQHTGQRVDGVIAIDPVALGYLLEAIGPVDVGHGITLGADNAADVLLSQVYAMFAEPSDQDDFFAGATERILDRFTAGAANNEELLDALLSASEEGRIHVWSAHEEEQAILASTNLAGRMPQSTAEVSAFGVYLNDATGAKMDYYLTADMGVAAANCRADGRPYFAVRVRLESSAPADAATSLPEYVTGGGVFGVQPGNVKTNVYVYAPAGAAPYSVTIDGQESAFVAADHDGLSVAGVQVELAPGGSTVIDIRFIGEAGAATDVSLEHTPMVSATETSVGGYLECQDIAPPDRNQVAASGLRVNANVT